VLVLGVAGYAGQVWWARRIKCQLPYHRQLLAWNITDAESVVQWTLAGWRRSPWWGEWVCDNNDPFAPQKTHVWVPRRFYYERFRVISGDDVGNDPDAWEAWFKAHPNLEWDETQKRLVEPKP